MPTPGFTSLLAFIAVLGLIPVALCLLKRGTMGGGAPDSTMRLISALPLSTQQRLLTVEVGQGDQRRWLVLGITAHTISTLHVMEPGAAAVSAQAAPAQSFAKVLSLLKTDRGVTP